MKTLFKKSVHWLRSRNYRTVLIFCLIIVSTGHVGRLLADREDVRQAFVGYVLAVSIDAVLVFSLYDVIGVRERPHRLTAVFVFLVTCVLSAGFNVQYYRENHPADAVWVSILLGAAAPVLAALMTVLKAFGDTERAKDELATTKIDREFERQKLEADRAFELEKFQIAQAEQTKRERAAERERTKRERAKAQAEQARMNTITQAEQTVTERATNKTERLRPGELDDVVRSILKEKPNIGPRPLARKLDISPSTANGILKRVRNNSNGSSPQPEQPEPAPAAEERGRNQR